MSLRRHSRATIAGWQGPHYPPLTNDLAAAFMDGPSNGAGLEMAMRQVAGFACAVDLPTSDDGYGWFWGAEFDVHGGKVLVAFPWTRDYSQADGSQLDRAPAIYTRGITEGDEVSPLQTANTVAARVIRALRPNSGRRPILQGR